MSPQLSSQTVSFDTTHQLQAAVTILLPFEPKITTKAKVEDRLRQLVAEANKILQEQFSKQEARQTILQLEGLIGQLDYTVHNRVVAFFVTPYSGKAQYWNMPVPETLVVGNKFSLRHVLQHQKPEKHYLLLTMGWHHAGIYLGNELKLSRLVANSPVNVGANAAQNTARLQNPGALHKEAMRHAVRHIDNALTILRKAYYLPLVVAASAEYLDCFKELSANAPDAVLIPNTHTDNERAVKEMLQSFLADWQSMKEKTLQHQLEAALQADKLAVGITEVWAAASEKRGKLLVAEEDYVFPAYLDKGDSVIYADAVPINQNARRTADAVEEAMIKVLSDGGQVALVRNSALADFLHVAMVCY